MVPAGTVRLRPMPSALSAVSSASVEVVSECGYLCSIKTVYNHVVTSCIRHALQVHVHVHVQDSAPTYCSLRSVYKSCRSTLYLVQDKQQT